MVPLEGILGMPRFGACAPAILSHRSPRAARRAFRLFASPCGLFEHRSIARNVTVSRSQHYLDALARCIP